MEIVNVPAAEWGVAALPHPNHSVLGDAYFVKPLPDGLLLAVVDGLGHGAEAATVSALCVDTLSTNSGHPLPALLRRCHERLRGTRGATMTVAAFDFANDEMSWSGIGDVAAVLLRAGAAAQPRAETLVLRAGLLGSGSPMLTASSVGMCRGDLVVLATDGIGAGFERAIDRAASPRIAAERILASYSKRTDDALVLVARYRGEKP